MLRALASLGSRAGTSQPAIGRSQKGTQAAFPLLHHNGEIHASVDRAIDVIDFRSRKWPDLLRPASDLHVMQAWCSWLNQRMRVAICVPHPILHQMFHRDVIDEQQFRAFGNQDDVLHKTVRPHVDGWLAVGTGTRCTGLRDGGDKQRDEAHTNHDASQLNKRPN